MQTLDADDRAVPAFEGEGPWELPALVTRVPLLFPHSLAPVTVGRDRSLVALEMLDESHLVAMFAQRDASLDDPEVADLFDVGCAGLVLQVAHVGDDDPAVIAFVGGVCRVKLRGVVSTHPALVVSVEVLHDDVPEGNDAEYSALARKITELFGEIVESSPSLSSDMFALLGADCDAPTLTDFVAGSLRTASADVLQALLETLDVKSRMKQLLRELLRERENLRLRDKIHAEVGKNISDAQRQNMLREQLKVIHRELGEDPDDRAIDELARRLDAASLPDEARREADRELARLARMPAASAEHSVARTYLDWLAALPWAREPRPRIELGVAREILDADHYDLDTIKARILEHLAVIALTGRSRGPLLCLVGPPGVGKTSIGRSIAEATGRQFVRISLGGIRDEAEIRGHRRTYVGALPGQIIRGLRNAGTADPVFMLDEIDKIGADVRGDPATALLEVLDPAQNHAFRDHYLEVAFDLSDVLFIATANVRDLIPQALHDRMEVVELPGYTEEEKVEIARRYLIPRQIEAHGLKGVGEVRFDDDALVNLVRGYTQEAGVRELERRLAAICRKHARAVLERGAGHLRVRRATVAELLGSPRFAIESDVVWRASSPGVAVALARTPFGGEVLFVEAARVPCDRGTLTITGQVREVMEESTRAALTWLRTHCDRYGLDPLELRNHDVHVHVPSGAVPKDGPSAGIVMVVALASLFTRQVVRPRTALSGEITLSGHVLGVGGIKEKVLAARRFGIATIVLPAQNRADVEAEIAPELRGELDIRYVDVIEEALEIAIGRPPDKGATAR